MTVLPLPTASRPALALTDLGNAERLVARHGDDMRYVATRKRWFLWNGQGWAEDQKGAVVELATDTVRAIYEEAAAADSINERRDLARHATHSETLGRIRAMIELAQSMPEVAITHQQLDADPWRLAVTNGTLDLRSGSLGPSHRGDLITKTVAAPYCADAACPRWLAFLDRVLAGNQELVDFLQRAIGYSLTGVTREHCLFLLHGGGANGKSTFLEVLRELLGEYAVQADFATFLERRTDGPRNDVARLVGARVVTSNEVGQGRRLNESLINSLTGGDTIAARFLFQEAFEFPPTFKLWFAANHKPIVRGAGEATWRRMRLIPFTVTIPEAERDEGLREVLHAELDGILRWAVEGCQLWLECGLRMPDEVRVATEGYREESDVLGAFLGERCELASSATESASELFQAYRSWALQCGEEAISLTRFGTALEERGFGKIKSHGLIRRAGLRLRSATTPGRVGTVGDTLPLYVVHDNSPRGTTVELSPTVPNCPRGAEYERVEREAMRDG